MDETTMGLIDSVFLVSYAIGQFIWGALADKVGPRRIVLGGLLASIVCSVGMGASTFLTAFLVINFLQGLAQSSGWAPLAKNLGSWFSRRERGQVFGWWTTNYAAGSVVALALAGGAIAWFGHWSYAFYVPAACLLFVLLLLWFFHADRPQDVGLPSIDAYHGELATEQPEEKQQDGSSWLELIRQPMIGLLAATYFLLKPTRYAILLWGPYYVALKLQSGAFFSAMIATSFAIAGIFGAIIAGTVSDRLFKAKRMPFMVICLIALSVVLFTFDGLVSQTVARVNKAQLTSTASELTELSEQYPVLREVVMDLSLLDKEPTLASSDAVARLRRAVVHLEGSAVADRDDQVALRNATVRLRKVARSEQFALFRAADIYKDRIRQIERRIKTLDLDENDPLLRTLSLLLKTRRMEIPLTVERLSLVVRDLAALADKRPALENELMRMRDDLQQIGNDIADYLDDRGDDMTFLYRTQLVDLIELTRRAEQRVSLIDHMNRIADRRTLLDAEDSFVDEQLSTIRAIARDHPNQELGSRIVRFVNTLEFERLYRPLRPSEEMTTAHWVMVACLFLIGFFVYAPDSQFAGVAAIDFGHHKGASSAAGFINGCGSVAAIFGGAGVGIIAQAFSWDILFIVFATMTLLAALMLFPKWNAVPTAETE